MNIYPQDLGRVGYRVTLYLRTLSGPRSMAPPLSPADIAEQVPLTGLRRAWMSGSDVPDKAARHARPVFDLCRASFWRGRPVGFVGAVLWSGAAVLAGEGFLALASDAHWLKEAIYPTWAALGAGYGYYFGLAKPRRLFRELHGPLTEAEVDALHGYVRDPLARDFLGVVRRVLPLPEMSDPEAAKNLRSALSALGEAIEGLPEQAPLAVREDPAALRREASGLSEQARRETDPIVSSSLDRRALSLSRRAQTVSSIALLVHRNQTLREEVSEQIKALSTSISAFSVGSHQGMSELADLAASIQHVAAEANSIASAQTELEVAIQGGPVPASGANQTARQDEPHLRRLAGG